MAIKVAAWNVEGRLSSYANGYRGSPRHILNGIQLIDADVIVLADAYHDNAAPGVDDTLRQMGYHWIDSMFAVDGQGVGGSRRRSIGLRILSRLPFGVIESRQLDDLRGVASVTIKDPETQKSLRIVGVHFDDRAESYRLRQAEALVAAVTEGGLPVVALGDFNALWDSRLARWIQSGPARWLASRAPGTWLRTMATRFTDMASGTTLRYIADNTGLRDADTKQQPTVTPRGNGATWLPSIRMAQLDHILIGKELAASKVTVMSDGGSDHRAIVSTVRLDL